MKKDIRFHFVAYLSPPPAKVGYGEFAENANFIDEENYRTMTECGFDRAIGLFENRTAHYLAGMRQAEKAGMEYFVRDQFKSGSLEGFIAHQFPDMISTIAVIVFMVIVLFSLNIWLALACILPIIVGLFREFWLPTSLPLQNSPPSALRRIGFSKDIRAKNLSSICFRHTPMRNSFRE